MNPPPLPPPPVDMVQFAQRGEKEKEGFTPSFSPLTKWIIRRADVSWVGKGKCVRKEELFSSSSSCLLACNANSE